MKDYIRKIYKQFLSIYDLIINENQQIRKNSLMKDAPSRTRRSDCADVSIPRDGLDDYDTAKDMLKRFKIDAREIGTKLNRDYREWFFKESSSSSKSSRRDRDFEPSSRSSRRHRDDDRDDRYKDRRGGRSDRTRDSRGGRDRGDRDRDRRSSDRYESSRSSRYDRRSRR